MINPASRIIDLDQRHARTWTTARGPALREGAWLARQHPLPNPEI